MIFTIGTSNRSLPEFLHELQKRRITRIIDVRSSPYSRVPWFNIKRIMDWSEQASIHYRHEGEILGGRSKIPVDDPVYIEALERIIEASCRERVAIFCAEGDPAQCHRSWDVAASLLVRYGVIARSILREGQEEDITDTLRRVDQRNFAQSLHVSLAQDHGILEPKLL
ncbi:MAG: DUF488 domain-containing protein [Novosphingobium sp.]|nr:DUF488 domain-containing protein [Novosphingobium sp.]MCP5401722.1 DUF488 domain-containing protein [Novosphingobium sp.]